MRFKLVLISAFVLIVATLFAGCGDNQPDNTKSTDVSDVTIGDTSALAEVASEELVTDSEVLPEVTTSDSASETETTAILTSETETPLDITAEETQPQTTEVVSETLAEVTLGEPQINFSDLV